MFKKRLKIGIVGCGAIGSSLAGEINTNFTKSARVSLLYDIDYLKSSELSRKLVKSKKLAAGSLKELIKESQLVIEASRANAAWDIAKDTLKAGKTIMIMSVGGIVGHLDELFLLAAKYNAQVFFPSGAISGVDALKAAKVAGIKKVVLTTKKNPKAFKGVDYVSKRFNLAGLKKDKVLFKGSARLAVRYFPQNVNVAAVLSLAGIGAGKTQVQIVASPQISKNVHEVLIESRAARIFTRTENILHPKNPKTSYLAVLSAIATLRQILEPVKIGT